MKLLSVLLPLILGFSAASANTVRIGNGGDTIAFNQPPTAILLMTAPHKLRLLAHSWMTRDPGDLVLQSARFNEFENAIVNTPLEIQKNPCVVKGEIKSAAAYTTPYRSVCVSWKRLEETAGNDLPELQILALLAHEYLHLLNYDENDAVLFQKQVVRYLIKYGIPSYSRKITNLIDKTALNSLRSVDWNNKNNVTTFAAQLNFSFRIQTESIIESQLSNYPILAPNKNVLSDILLRLNYLNLITVANWGQGPDVAELRQTLATYYFPKTPSGYVSISASYAAQLLQFPLRFSLIYPKNQIPYIDPDHGQEQYMSVLAEAEHMIDDLNQSLFGMGYNGTPIRFMDLKK